LLFHEKGKKVIEKAIVVGIGKQGFQVLVERYGLEGHIKYSEEDLSKNQDIMENQNEIITVIERFY
jgi:hypothetical protein